MTAEPTEATGTLNIELPLSLREEFRVQAIRERRTVKAIGEEAVRDYLAKKASETAKATA